MAKKTGLEGEFQDAGVKPGASLVNREAVQPSLIDDDELAEEAEAAAAMFGYALDAGGAKGGRPPGSRNRSTGEVRRFIQAMGADPVVAASRIVRAGPAWVFDQAQQMKRTVERNVGGEAVDVEEGGIDPAKAWDIWLRCVDFLGPYVHSKQPIAVQMDQPGLAIQINVGSPETAAAIEAATGGRARYTLDTEKSDTYEGDAEEVTRGDSHTDTPSD